MFFASFLNENWHIKEILHLVTHMGANLGLFKSPNANIFISTGVTEPKNSRTGETCKSSGCQYGLDRASPRFSPTACNIISDIH